LRREYAASAKLAERKGFERAVRFSLITHSKGLGWSPTILPDPINHLRVPN
jgi:hypothetical protein